MTGKDLGIRRWKSVGQPVPAHFVLLMSADAKIGVWFGGAEQNESSLAILGEIIGRVRVIEVVFICVFAFTSPGTGETAALMANRMQLNTLLFGRVPNVLVFANLNLCLPLWHEQGYGVGFHSNFSLQFAVLSKSKSSPRIHADEADKAQTRVSRLGAELPRSVRSGFRQRARTPAKRLKLGMTKFATERPISLRQMGHSG